MESKPLVPSTFPEKPKIYSRSRPLQTQMDLPVQGYASVAYTTPDGKYLALLCQDNIEIWSILKGIQLLSYKMSVFFWLAKKWLNGTADSKNILFQNMSGDVVQWSCKKKTLVHMYKHHDTVIDIVTNQNNQFWTSTNSTIYLWDIQFKTLLMKYKHRERNFSFLYLVQNYLYSNANGPNVYIFDMDLGEDQQQMKFDFLRDDEWSHKALSPCYKYFAYTNQNHGTIWIASMQEQTVVHMFSGYQDPYDKVHFSIDGKYLVAQSSQRTSIFKLEGFEEIISLSIRIIITTSCNRLFNGFVIKSKYYDWSEQALSVLMEIYNHQQPLAQKIYQERKRTLVGDLKLQRFNMKRRLDSRKSR